MRRRRASRANDSAILDWAEQFTDGRVWTTIHVHDSRDMGYTKDFVTVNIRGEFEGKGNSLREALSAAMAASKAKSNQ